MTARDYLLAARDLVYPPTCLVCRSAIREPTRVHALCDGCFRAVRIDPFETCPRCASTVGPHTFVEEGCPRCRGETYAFNGAFRFGPYDGVLRDAVLMMKHLNGEALAETLGNLWVAERPAQFQPKPDVIIPIALHWQRRLVRGYNQSAAVAQAISESIGVPCQPHCLRRIRRTPAQTAQTPGGRRVNVRGAFRTSCSARVKALRVLLIDDVLTTGATADAAASALLAAGAAQVTVGILAHR